MKRLLAALLATVALAFATPAEAVTYQYCHSSLRGGGSLAPDPDVFTYANSIGANPIYHVSWSGGSGSYTVYETIRFYRSTGPIDRRFYCSGSGATYSDGRAF